MSPLVTLHDVSKSYGSRTVIRDLSLEVRAGEVLAVVGPSGIGKTTLLKMIAGLEEPTRGTVKRAGARFGYVFQEPRLLPWKTARDNLILPLIAAGYAPGEARTRADRWLERVGLAESGDHYPSQLSGGMAQRVGLARAFAVDPDVLLLDEPFSGLDPDRRKTMRGLLDELLAGRDMTVFYITHDGHEMHGFATRRLVFGEAGRLAVEPGESGCKKR